MMDERSDILLVDDDRTVIAVLSQILHELGRLRFATSGADALNLARDSAPDLVVLDVELPGMDGFEVCKIMKADPVLADVPVIFLTSRDSTEHEVRGLSLGASDFISKPANPALVKARVSTHLRLKKMTDALRRAATIDGLTGVANRRELDQRLSREWLRAQRMGLPIALLMVDIDYFKQYNDRYGHPAGDECLKSVARAVALSTRRPADLVARYGGEEFAILLPETDARGARSLADLLLRRVEALDIAHARSEVAEHVTISIGVSAYDQTSRSWPARPSELRLGNQAARLGPSALVSAADRALYAAKRSGRNRACFAELEVPGAGHDAAARPTGRDSHG